MTNREFWQKTGNCGEILNGNSGIEKYSNRWFHSRLTIAETSISELEGRAEENIHSEAQRQKDEEEKQKRQMGHYQKSKILIVGVSGEEKQQIRSNI